MVSDTESGTKTVMVLIISPKTILYMWVFVNGYNKRGFRKSELSTMRNRYK